jgi:hypothetical protein
VNQTGNQIRQKLPNPSTEIRRREALWGLTGAAATTLSMANAPLFGADTRPNEPNSAVDRLLERVIASEQKMMKTLAERNPIVETYIQEEAGAGSSQKDGRDHYFLGRMTLVNSVNYVSFVKRSVEVPVVVTETKSKLKLPFGKKQAPAVEAPEPVAFFPVGFAQMALIDSKAFDRSTYKFDFIRREFLGEVRCLVFDVGPIDATQSGKFMGRIWVEDQEACVVRLNGTYTGRSKEGVYFHFDSWRVNAAPGLWIPAVIYIEDSVAQQDSSGIKTTAQFKGQTRIWSYDSQSRRKLDELTTMLVESENQVKENEARQEVSPIEGQRRWEREAELNVIERLEKIGLVAPTGDVDRVLNTVVNNLIITNQLDIDAQCRLMLSTPLESFTIGHTVVVSRGLVDVLPDEASLALVLAMELAHIALAHPTRTEYAFNDRTMVGDEAVLDRFRFSRTPEEVASAMKKASQMLANSPYKDKLGGAGLFLKALKQKSPSLPRLIQATLGNDLTTYLQTPEFVELLEKAPSIEDAKLEQIAALPLGSRIRLEPWANQSYLMKTRAVALLSAREKMPFEIAPVNVHLTRLAKTGTPGSGQ